MSREPFAIPSQHALLVRGFYPIVQRDCWWDIPIDEVLAVVMEETRGHLNPKLAKDFFERMVSDKGLSPVV